jgi:hypothetical protein
MWQIQHWLQNVGGGCCIQIDVCFEVQCGLVAGNMWQTVPKAAYKEKYIIFISDSKV